MNRGDRVEEWRQLRDRHITMTEDELQAIAAEAYDLTDLAKQALQGELQRRGLPIKLAGAKPEIPPEEEVVAPGDFDPTELDLESVRDVWDMQEASKVMAALHAAGVPCYLWGQKMLRGRMISADRSIREWN